MAQEFVAMIPVDPNNNFMCCGVEDCSLGNPHENIIIRGSTPAAYVYLHRADYDGEINIEELEKDSFGTMHRRKS